MFASDALGVADYRLLVASIYARAREDGPSPASWARWAAARDSLFRTHAESPIAAAESFSGIPYFPYDPAYRIIAAVEPQDGDRQAIAHSRAGSTEFVPFGSVSLRDLGIEERLTVYWLTTYGGGVFLPFRDGTSGAETYGGGRYLVDTVKGAYLGGSRSHLVLDFNYAYHPSCVYSDEWSCPLAPPENYLEAPIRAGEMLSSKA